MTASEERQLRYWTAMSESASQLRIPMRRLMEFGFRTFAMSDLGWRILQEALNHELKVPVPPVIEGECHDVIRDVRRAFV